jgi:hypothetical protein
MANLSDLHFPPTATEYVPPPSQLYWANYPASWDTYWRVQRFNFIQSNLGVIAKPAIQVHMPLSEPYIPLPTPVNQVQPHIYRYPPVIGIIQPPPPELPLWRAPRVSHTNRARAFNFFLMNTTTHICEPDRHIEPSPKRRQLNQPLFPPLSHPYCQTTDPLQAVIKSEETP